jgi:putative redox protein
MKLTTTWNGKYHFAATDGGRTAPMDILPPFGDGTALSPKQLCLAGLMGCTAMDVYAHLNKRKQLPERFWVEADAPVREKSPAVFLSVQLDFHFEGATDPAQALEAVQLSQTKYCGVSAMIAKACPVRYRVHVNGKVAGEGEAKFPDW